MAEDSDLERSEPASPRRLEQAREEGQVARSVELSAFAVLAAAAGAMWLSGGFMARHLAALMSEGLTFTRETVFDPQAMGLRLVALAAEAGVAVLPLGVAVLLAALVAPMLVNGWVFSASALAPDFGRLNPANGLGRMASLTSVVELGKAIAKALVIGSVAVWFAWSEKAALLSLASLPLEGALAEVARIAVGCFFAAVCGLALIVAVDVPFQLWEHHRKLRMTREEVRQENKETEGDPHVKARVRSLQREAARKRMMAEVPKADVVVTNPTHYAVALRYESGEMGAPRVVAKGQNLLAARIRELAVEHRVPVLEAPPLARALYRHAELDAEIPAALYNAVAEVLVYVYQLRRGATPRPPAALPVPPDLDPEAGVA